MSDEAARPRLLVVGTVHLDPEGEQKLLALLEAVRPACVTVEVSRWGLLFRHRTAPELLRRLAERVEGAGKTPSDSVLALRAMLAEPFEHRAARLYAASHGASVVPVDLSSISHDKLAALSEVFAPGNLEQLIADAEFGLSRSVIEQQLLARRYRHDQHLFAWHFRKEEKIEMAVRGQAMARVIAGHLARVAPGTVVHVGGWNHLVRSQEGNLHTLATLLDESGLEWIGVLLGDTLPPPWAPEPEGEPEEGGL